MLLFVIRHGEPDYATDTLTDTGHLQAAACAERLASYGLDRVYSSPMGRARQTAEYTCRATSLDLRIAEFCSEALAWQDFTYVDAQGRRRWICDLPNTDFRAPDNLYRSVDWRQCDCLLATGEPLPYDRLIAGSDAFLRELGYERDGGVYRILRPNDDRVALFCHGGFGSAWLPHLMALPPHLVWAGYELSLTGVSVFRFSNPENGLTAPRCVCWSDTSHLYKAGLPTGLEAPEHYGV